MPPNPEAMLENMDDELFLFGGLPFHPLVIHAVVVLTPLLSLGLLVSIAVSRIRVKYLGILVAGLGLTTVCAFLARQSGEELAEVVGVTEQHESLGETHPLWVLSLFAVSLAWFLVERKGGAKILVASLKSAVVVLAVVVTIMTVLVGHSGTESVWASRVASPVEAPQAEPTEDSEPPADNAVTAATVSEHATADDCWTIIDGDVYDLTPFISSHPGGAAAVTALCGRDGTTEFLGKHESNSSALSRLDSLRIGELATP